MKVKISVMLLTVLFISTLAQETNSKPAHHLCLPSNNPCDELVFDIPGSYSHCNVGRIEKEEAAKITDQRKKIAFYLQSGVEVLDFAGPMEVFSYAGHEVFTVSKITDPIISQGIIKIIPDYDITNAPKADIIAFFGGNAQLPANDPEVIQWVKAQQGVEYYFSVCTGAFILAEAGILKGKTATTFHNSLDHLEKNYPDIKVLKNARYVDNGNIITTAGISAGIDGALHLVAKLQGFNAARNVAYYMEYDRWTPGEGLNLSNENPYEKFMDVALLQEYVGIYEFINDTKVELKINENEKSIFAVYEGRAYPFFYQKKDMFELLDSETLIFERDNNSMVSGFRVTGAHEGFFRKLE